MTDQGRLSLGRGRRSYGLYAGIVLGVSILWSYWPTLAELWRAWWGDPNYSAGLLLPLITAYVLWWWRGELARMAGGPCWWGLAVLGVSQVLRLFGVYWIYASIERYSLIVAVAGLVLLLAGPAVLWRLRWLMVVGLLAMPLPGRVEEMVSLPLQGMATAGARFVLELAGVLVVQEGHVLHLAGQTSIAVAEACSGLRMLTAFLLVAGVMAMVVQRPGWQRVSLLVSGVAVAVVMNMVRLAATGGFALATHSSPSGRFHDLAGLAMMPVAVGMLALELWFFSKLVPPAGQAITRGPSGG